MPGYMSGKDFTKGSEYAARKEIKKATTTPKPSPAKKEPSEVAKWAQQKKMEREKQAQSAPKSASKSAPKKMKMQTRPPSRRGIQVTRDKNGNYVFTQ